MPLRTPTVSNDLNPQRIVVEDDFLFANTAVGLVGSIGWIRLNTGNGSVGYTPGTSDHPGMINISVNATSGLITGLSTAATPTSNDMILPTQVERMIYVFRPNSVTSVNFRIGLMQDPLLVTGGTDGVWWDFTPGTSAFWRSITRASSSNTTNTTSVTVTAANWYKCEMRRQGGGNWEFWLNDSLKFTHSANLPTTACVPAFQMENGSTASKNMDIDYFGMRSVALGRRWT